MSNSIEDLLDIMARLRSAEGCPWDRQQTHSSLRQYLVEEAYEVVAAIDERNDCSIKEELGDLLLQVLFHSQIASEEGRFDFQQVVDSIAAKMVRRHPHVFGQATADDASRVRQLWEEIKAEEKKEKRSDRGEVEDGFLPALLKAFKIQRRAAEKGFDWPEIGGAFEKLREEFEELEEACGNADRDAVEEEIGDLLFSLVNIARFLKVNPEMALGKTVKKFSDRFQHVMDQVRDSGRPAGDFSLAELDQWWEEAKYNKKKDNKSRNCGSQSE